MKFDTYRDEWLNKICTQEALLRVDHFSADDALTLGCTMIRLAREKYRKPAGFRIITNGQITFSFLMDGTDLNNCWWMDKKLNTCRLSGVSSLRTMIELAKDIRPLEPEYENANNFALCGGCFPLRTPADRLLGWVLCSGLPHYCDHQLIADALAEYLDAEIPEIGI